MSQKGKMVPIASVPRAEIASEIQVNQIRRPAGSGSLAASTGMGDLAIFGIGVLTTVAVALPTRVKPPVRVAVAVPPARSAVRLEGEGVAGTAAGVAASAGAAS